MYFLIMLPGLRTNRLNGQTLYLSTSDRRKVAETLVCEDENAQIKFSKCNELSNNLAALP